MISSWKFWLGNQVLRNQGLKTTTEVQWIRNKVCKTILFPEFKKSKCKENVIIICKLLDFQISLPSPSDRHPKRTQSNLFYFEVLGMHEIKGQEMCFKRDQPQQHLKYKIEKFPWMYEVYSTALSNQIFSMKIFYENF